MAGRPAHKQLNDAFCVGGMMQLPECGSAARLRIAGGLFFREQHSGGQSAETLS
jgi:hypothetical protein